MSELPVIELSRSGVLVVDMQNGFVHPEGDLGRRGQGAALRAVVPQVAELVRLAHDVGLRVYWSHQEHDPDDVTRSRHRVATHVAKQEHLPCLRGTWDAEIADQLKPLVAPSDYHFVKHRASCFYDTPLEVALRMAGIEMLIVAGVTTNYCVDSTIRDGYARDLDLVVLEDCCAANYPDLHAATMRNVSLYHGVVTTLPALRLALGTRAGPAGRPEAPRTDPRA